jgi:hypothetical protein
LFLSAAPAFAGVDSSIITEQYVMDSNEYYDESEDDNFVEPERKLTESEWRYLTLDSAFSYRNLRENEQKIKANKSKNNWALNALKQLFIFLASGLGQFIFWGLIAGMLAYVIYKLFKGDFSFLRSRKDTVIATESSEVLSLESLTTADWDGKMNAALSVPDYRLATRFAFLSILQKMHEKHHIEYRINTTNYEYFLSLKNETLKAVFKQLLLKYEYAWFGKFSMNASEWQKVLELFNNAKSNL